MPWNYSSFVVYLYSIRLDENIFLHLLNCFQVFVAIVSNSSVLFSDITIVVNIIPEGSLDYTSHMDAKILRFTSIGDRKHGLSAFISHDVLFRLADVSQFRRK